MTRRSRDSVADVWGDRTPYFGEGAWPVRVDEHLEEEPQRWVQSCCVLCTNGCAVDIGVKDGRIVGVRGRADDRINRGRLGPKGLNGWMANNSPDRLTRPLIREGGKPGGSFREASWDEAMDLVAGRCREVRDKYTGGAVGIYNSGQLFLEDYYTLSVIARAGLGTNHIDGNTRLCTATAAMSLRETFGRDGQPSTAADYDLCDCLVHFGHNIATTQTVSWMRILDRRRGPNPPRLIAVDPRTTPTAAEADIHLAPRVGTNLAVMNGLLHLVIAGGHIDPGFIETHTVGFEALRERVAGYTPQRVQDITGIPAAQLRDAARVIGSAERLLCTVLQGFYQAHEATASACQVNNLVLIRGMIGKPGCGVIQSNGQPTAQNTRETGCDGELPAFRNWQNPRHVADLARVWNVEPHTIPHWAPSTHAMQIFRLAELGSIRFLWIVCTNPAVSLPELHRIRRILTARRLFVVVQDAFLTETAELADVVLPAAIWGEKTGTFTNFDRTVHLSLKAVEPPGEARPDMDIFLDFARRMGFKDKDGAPLVKWSTPEQCFEAWKECSKGWACDYSGLSHAKLAGGSGLQWPCNGAHPEGKTRLYEDHRFPTGFEECTDFGHDLETGAHRTATEYKAEDPAGRAILKAADYRPPYEEPDDTYPFWLTTGRVVYHFHTRTKTGRCRELAQAAPDAFIQVNEEDAKRLGIDEGEMVEVASRRGTARAAARIGGIIPGHLFMPFHYGYWDEPDSTDGGPDGRPRAANELTLTAWDAVSKQPNFKYAAVQLRKAGKTGLIAAAKDLAGKVADRGRELKDLIGASLHTPRSHVGDYLGLLRAAHEQFAAACDYMTRQHAENAEIREGSLVIGDFSRRAAEELRPFAERYGERASDEPEALRRVMFPESRFGSYGLLRDIHALYLMACESHISNTIVMDAAKELRDDALLRACVHHDGQIKRQQAWCITMNQESAAQSVVVPA
jgi:anaerobic selenocysteine-containing dehydrogenase